MNEEERQALNALKEIKYCGAGIPLLNYQAGEILNLIDKQQQEIKTLKFRLDCKEQVHQYDVSMIDEVKGEAVKLYREIDNLKKQLQEDEYQEWLIARNEN